jgi:hypothetical protein
MKSNLAKSHDAMLKFLEKLIENSDKFPTKSRGAQRHYDAACKLVERAYEVSGVPNSSGDRK